MRVRAPAFALRMSTCVGPHPMQLHQVAIDAFWHARCHRDPGNQWLRGLLFDTFAELDR